MKIDIDFLQQAYFQFDEPVPYEIDKEHEILIYPVSLRDSELFISSAPVISVDKDKMPDADIISMPYLDFMIKYLLTDEDMCVRFVNILKLCLHFDDAIVNIDNVGRYYLTFKDSDIKINGKKFNDIRRIILYQNIIGYDDGYIDPELKKAMEETDKLKSRDLESPNLERKMAIISSHNGMTKKQQLSMTMREHSMLFREVAGETDFRATWAIALYSGEAKKMEHWIFKKKKGKLDGYIVDRSQFVSKLGADPNNIKQTSDGESLDNMFDDFNK